MINPSTSFFFAHFHEIAIFENKETDDCQVYFDMSLELSIPVELHGKHLIQFHLNTIEPFIEKEKKMDFENPKVTQKS